MVGQTVLVDPARRAPNEHATNTRFQDHYTRFTERIDYNVAIDMPLSCVTRLHSMVASSKRYTHVKEGYRWMCRQAHVPR